MWATTVGLRGNATAMAVPRLARRVCCAATASGRKGSWRVSAVQSPSKPRSSAARAISGTSARVSIARVASIFTVASRRA